MNFLAHAYLSGDNPQLLVGNFIGDFVKGRDIRQRFEKDIANGIELHRMIDAFTDSHPVVMNSKKRLREKYRHYAPVIVDMYYDHFLAVKWSNYHTLPLLEFVANTYQTLNDNFDVLPEKLRYMLPYMMRGNWLVNYGKVEGIQRALTGMSRRTSFNSQMEDAVNDLLKHYKEFGDEFELFFPDLVKYSQGEIEKFQGGASW